MAHTITRLPRGDQAQFGIGVEASYGAVQTIGTFFRIPAGGFGVKMSGDDAIRFRSAGLVPGLISAPSLGDVMNPSPTGEGPVNLEVTRKGMLKLFDWMHGGTTPTPAQQGATTAYLTTFEPGLMTAAGKSLTMQGGVPGRDGVVEPWTFVGCKCTGYEVTGDVGGFVTLQADVLAQLAQHTTDLATYTAPAEYIPYHWTHAGVVKRAGAAIAGAKSWKFKVDNGLTGADRKLLDATGKIAEPVESSPRSGQLDIEMEWAGNTLYDLWAADTGSAFVVEYVGAIIATIYPYTLRLTIPDGHIIGEPPVVDGAEMVSSTVSVEARSNGTNLPWKWEIIETATTV